jgi:hypothetical protein
MYVPIGRGVNQNIHFWINISKRYRNAVQKNFSVFGDNPKNLVDMDHLTDITRPPSWLPSFL